MVAAHGVVVSAGAAVAHHRRIAGQLDVAPHRQGTGHIAGGAGGGCKPELVRRAIGVDLCEAAGHRRRVTGGTADGLAHILEDAVVERIEATPGDGDVWPSVDDGPNVLPASFVE